MNQFQRAQMSPEALAAHDAEVKARARKYQREWRKKNAKGYYAKQRARRANDGGKYKEWQKVWVEKNRERVNKNAREWARKNPEKNKAKFLAYLNKNRAARYEEWARNQAIKRGCIVADRERMIQIYQEAIDLTKSTGVKWSVDHIICVGLKGPHRPENAQPMPMSINQIKSGNPFWICKDGKFKDWRDVPMKFWPKEFTEIYDAVLSHAEGGRAFYSMTA